MRMGVLLLLLLKTTVRTKKHLRECFVENLVNSALEVSEKVLPCCLVRFTLGKYQANLVEVRIRYNTVIERKLGRIRKITRLMISYDNCQGKLARENWA